MADDQTYHILLLPTANYWDWVGASRDYAVQFGVSITSLPENAASFRAPNQLISVVIPGDGYPAYGDIVQWFRAAAYGARLDVLSVATPDALRQILDQRRAAGMRLGSPAAPALSPARPAPFRLLWPTDYAETTQGFGENPDVYRRWGLPGHEGIDFKAPLNSNVYACADGHVYLVHDGSGGHPYGIHVRIRHSDGYSTVYAHLNQALVHAGQVVHAGERIGLADSTGNSSGHHMHLTLKKAGATTAGLTSFPNDILDPSPFLVYPAERHPPDPLAAQWPYGRCLIGLHGRADGAMQSADWEAVRTARVEALKLTSLALPEDVERALTLNPEMFVMVRLLADFRDRAVPAAEFARWIEFDMGRFYEKGVRYFEVHNEPNLRPEGYGISWESGRDFGEWFLQVIGLLRPSFPEARFGWPGLSPGASEGMRFDHRAFLESAGTLVSQADWIGCHCYWQTEDAMMSPDGGLGYQLTRDNWPDKLTFITEFSNTSPTADRQTKASQYLKYFRHVTDEPGIAAAFAFVVSAAHSYPHETWRYEDGSPSAISEAVGARSF